MVAFSLKPTTLAFLFTLAACGGDGKSALEKSLPPPTKKLTDLKAAKSDMTPEELAAARKAAGFKSRDEIAKENAEMFEKGAREYVKTRVKEYRSLIADLRTSLDELEGEAGKWEGAKDAQGMFDKFVEKYREKTKKLTKRYDELTGKGAEGGNTQALFGKAFRAWEDLNNDLGPGIGKQERFAATLKEIREGWKAVEAAVEEIEKDESLVPSKFYEGEKADEEKKGD